MNDLETLRTALLPDEPSQDVFDRSRHRLQNRMLGRRRRIRPLAIGAGLLATAAVAAGVVVVVTRPAAPVEAPPQAVAPVETGPAVLLAAARVAERAQVGAGRYWHTTTKVGKQSWEYWTTTDGREWYRDESHGGKVRPLPRARPIRINGDDDVTLSTILSLPPDPAALRTWLTDGLTRLELPADQLGFAVLGGLTDLVSTVPAPPAVRAAAFRAIAAYPGVTALPDGKSVRLPGGGRLVVDPATGQVDSSSVFLDWNGKPATNGNGDTYAVSGEWTDELPK